MKFYELSESARQDLNAIIDYLSNKSPKATREMQYKLLKTCQFLAEYPHSGRERPELTMKKDLQFFAAHTNYLIAYKIETAEKISIRNFLHAARDISVLLN